MSKKGNDKGVVGIFKDPEKLKRAAVQFRDRKVKKFDAFTPFPVHGLEDAMAIPRSWLPWVTFLAGLIGTSAGLGLEIWVSVYQWPHNIGGKPPLSLPAFIPVAFETTILFAGLATAAALFFVCKIPNFKPQIFSSEITNDQFALFISSNDTKYHEAEFVEILKKAGADEVRVV